MQPRFHVCKYEKAPGHRRIRSVLVRESGQRDRTVQRANSRSRLGADRVAPARFLAFPQFSLSLSLSLSSVSFPARDSRESKSVVDGIRNACPTCILSCIPAAGRDESPRRESHVSRHTRRRGGGRTAARTRRGHVGRGNNARLSVTTYSQSVRGTATARR